MKPFVRSAEISLFILISLSSFAAATITDKDKKALNDALATVNVPQLKIFAERGDPSAQVELATVYQMGTRAPLDYIKASELLVQAAKQMSIDAFGTIAQNYSEGRGVSIDTTTAQQWWKMATDRSHHQDKWNSEWTSFLNDMLERFRSDTRKGSGVTLSKIKDMCDSTHVKSGYFEGECSDVPTGFKKLIFPTQAEFNGLRDFACDETHGTFRETEEGRKTCGPVIVSSFLTNSKARSTLHMLLLPSGQVDVYLAPNIVLPKTWRGSPAVLFTKEGLVSLNPTYNLHSVAYEMPRNFDKAIPGGLMAIGEKASTNLVWTTAFQPVNVSSIPPCLDKFGTASGPITIKAYDLSESSERVTVVTGPSYNSKNEEQLQIAVTLKDGSSCHKLFDDAEPAADAQPENASYYSIGELFGILSFVQKGQSSEKWLIYQLRDSMGNEGWLGVQLEGPETNLDESFQRMFYRVISIGD